MSVLCTGPATPSLSIVLLTIERVALLRRVDLFADTPDRVLAGVAQVLEEVEFAAGETVIEAGAIEDWLFVIVDGEFEVVKFDQHIVIPAGGVVGELAVHPRPAVRAHPDEPLPDGDGVDHRTLGRSLERLGEHPVEIAHWVPETPAGQQAAQINDVFVGAELDIWVTDRVNGGVYALEPEAELADRMRATAL